MSVKTYQPRYRAYAAAHGRTCEAQGAHDLEQYPSGRMLLFMEWIAEQWRAWAHTAGEQKRGAWDTRQHELFDKWLEQKYLAS